MRVINSSCRQSVMGLIKYAYGHPRYLTRLPVPHPKPLTRKDMANTSNLKDFVVAEKSDGVRYLLCLGRYRATHSPYAVLVNRKLEAFQLEVCCPADMYRGTVFDAELVLDKQQFLKLLVFDCAMFAGKSLRGAHFPARWAKVVGHFESPSAWNPQRCSRSLMRQLALSGKIIAENTLWMYAKQIMPISAHDLLRRTPLSHDSDGFVVTRSNCGLQAEMYKLKFVASIDVQVGKGGTLLCRAEDKSLLPLTEALPDLDVQLRDCPEIPPGILVELNVLSIDGRTAVCAFHRIRTDKAAPNPVFVIKGVLQKVKESITPEEVWGLVGQRSA